MTPFNSLADLKSWQELNIWAGNAGGSFGALVMRGSFARRVQWDAHAEMFLNLVNTQLGEKI